MALHNEIGKNGEKIGESFLVKKGFLVLERNYSTKFGELDIIAEKDNVLHFVEVKSVKVFDFLNINKLKIQPEENLTKSKWNKLQKTIEIYLKHRSVSCEKKIIVDLLCVYINLETREGKVKFLENIWME